MITLNALELWDMGLGPHLVPVTPPDVPISPTSKLARKALGKAPGMLTVSGWTGVDLTDPRFRCHDYDTAKRWTEWHANVGLVVGNGFAVIDNDQGETFSTILSEAFRAIGVQPLRRYVADPKHKRDAYVFHVVESLANRDLKFRNGVGEAKIQILGHDKQAVIYGTHPGTRCPYVWDRDHAFSNDDIPTLDPFQLTELMKMLVNLSDQQGWKFQPGQTLDLTAAQGTVSSVPPNSSPPPDPKSVQALIQDAAHLLAQIPNRDVPPGEKPTAIDEWLDDHENWIKILYALVAHLGPVANTPQAENLWLEWAYGRAQDQDPETKWRSAISNPLQMGPVSLIKILKGIPGALPPTGFPEVDPADPLLQTPIWDHLRHTYAWSSKGVLNIETGVVVSRQAFADLFAADVGKLIRELKIAKKKPGNAADIFMEQPDKLKAKGFTYAPGEPRLSPEGIFNFWKETTVVAAPVAESQIKTWLNHVDFVLGKNERDQFVKWCAFVAQFPELKPNWHYLVMSDQGLGKDTMLLPVKLAVGKDNYCNEQIDYLADSDFNDYFLSKLLVISETGQSNNASSYKIRTRLNRLTATPPETMRVNLKNQARFDIPNRHAVILFSNEIKPLHLPRDQRRIYVVNQIGVKPKPHAYYVTFNQWLDNNAHLVASYLLTLPLTPADRLKFVGGTAPKSASKTLLEQLSVDPNLDDFEQLIADILAGVDSFVPLATIDQIVSHLRARTQDRNLKGQRVRSWLLDMERRQKGVGRVRKDPQNPGGVGVIKRGDKGGRLWHLTPDYQGRSWRDFTDAELIAIWDGQKLPLSAKVLNFPADNSKDADEKI